MSDTSGEIPQIGTAEITFRKYGQYIDFFALDKRSLKGKTICDFAGGLGDFTEYINFILPDTGTKAVSLDLIYKEMAEDDYKPTYDYLSKKIGTSVLTSHTNDSNQSKTTFLEKRANISHRLRGMQYSSKRARNENLILPYIAGSTTNVPFKSDSFDLILSSNLLGYPIRFSGESARRPGNIMLSEALRILKMNGELRIQPIRNMPIEGDTVHFVKTEYGPSDEYPLVDLQEIDALEKFESHGISFYLVVSDQTDKFLVARKDNMAPTEFDPSKKYNVYKLDFGKYNPNWGTVIPSKMIACGFSY